MRVSREQVEKNRERILEVATRLFLERGFDGIGVADLMKAAGLTHGCFYGHFESKEALIAEACARSLACWHSKVATTEGDPLALIKEKYLSVEHRNCPGDGCLLASLGTEISRQNPTVRSAVTDGLRRIFSTLAKIVRGRSEAARRRKAIATFAALVGGMVLARSVDDPTLSNEILEAVSESV